MVQLNQLLLVLSYRLQLIKLGLTIGVECTYMHKAPFGFQTERFKAEVLGFTASGRVRIKAFDTPNKEWYKTTVSRSSLRPMD